MKLYIAVLDEFPDYMVPTLVAHSMLGAHMEFIEKAEDADVLDEYEPYTKYTEWLHNSFKKCVVRVSQKEFDKITSLSRVYLGHENKTLGGKKACAVVCPYAENEKLPNVLKFAKLWKPKDTMPYKTDQ